MRVCEERRVWESCCCFYLLFKFAQTELARNRASQNCCAPPLISTCPNMAGLDLVHLQLPRLFSLWSFRSTYDALGDSQLRAHQVHYLSFHPCLSNRRLVKSKARSHSWCLIHMLPIYDRNTKYIYSIHHPSRHWASNPTPYPPRRISAYRVLFCYRAVRISRKLTLLATLISPSTGVFHVLWTLWGPIWRNQSLRRVEDEGRSHIRKYGDLDLALRLWNSWLLQLQCKEWAWR